MEVAPGVHRLEFAIDTKPMAMYVIAGDRLMLIDTGLPDTPERIYLPAIEALGRTADEVELIIITHADADHIGGNAAARRLFPHAKLICHVDDQRWASDPAVIMAERYDGFAPYGLRYEQAVFDMLASWMGPAAAMDLLVTGGERIHRTGDEWLEVLHLPGHTLGHIGLYNPRHRYAIVGDAVFGRSQLDTHGQWSAPPPYMTVEGYRATIETLAALDLDLLLTCHYPVMRGAEIRQFLDASSQFIDRASDFITQLMRTAREPVTLREAVARADPELGPFGFPDDLQFALLAHLDDEVTHRRAKQRTENGMVTWVATE